MRSARPVCDHAGRSRLTSSVVLPVPAAASTTSVSSSASLMRSRSASVGDGGHGILRSASRSASGRAASQRAVFLVRPAHRAEVAIRAGARRAGVAARVPRSIARSMISSTSRPRRRVSTSSGIGCVEKPPARGAVRQPPFLDRHRRQALERQAVQHRLQHLAAVDDGGELRAVLAGLVIGDAHDRCPALPLHEVDRAAEQEAAVHRDRLGDVDAGRAARRVGQAERQLEALRHPVAVRRPAARASGSSRG